MTSRPQTSWPAIVVRFSLALLFTIAIAFMATWSGDFSRRHTADSLMPALVSTQHISWYYWGQNRLGNLIPILTARVSDIDTNFRMQVALRAWFGSLGLLFFVVIARPRAPLLAVYGGIVLAFFLVTREFYAFEYLVDAQPYGTSLAILAAAVVLADRVNWNRSRDSKVAGGGVFLLLLMALWVNLSAALFVGPVFFGLAVLRRSRAFAVLTVLLIFAFVVVSLHASTIEGPRYALAALSWASIVASLQRLAMAIPVLPASIGAAGAFVAFLYLAYSKRVLDFVAVIAAAIAASFLVTVCIDHVANNNFDPRYLLMQAVAAIALGAILIVEALSDLVASRRMSGLFVAGLLTASLAVVGWTAFPLDFSRRFYPSDARSANAEEIADLAIANNATFIGGNDYWTIWPAVFLAIKKSGRPFYGLGFRGDGPQITIAASIASNSEPIVFCFGLPLSFCVDHIDIVLGRKMGVIAWPIASGTLGKDPAVSWTAGQIMFSPRAGGSD